MYRAWVLLAFFPGLLGVVIIVCHGLPLCATLSLSFNTRTRPVNKQQFHGTLRPLLLPCLRGTDTQPPSPS